MGDTVFTAREQGRCDALAIGLKLIGEDRLITLQDARIVLALAAFIVGEPPMSIVNLTEFEQLLEQEQAGDETEEYGTPVQFQKPVAPTDRFNQPLMTPAAAESF